MGMEPSESSQHMVHEAELALFHVYMRESECFWDLLGSLNWEDLGIHFVGDVLQVS